MTRFESLPAAPSLRDLLTRFPQGLWSLCEFHDARLRGPSPLSVAQRELIAAYVSGLNGCEFCFVGHRNIAVSLGVEVEVFEGLVDDPEASGVEQAMLPLLAYARQLTRAPDSVRDADAAAVFEAGWDEQALFDTITVTALFNLMNRLVQGSGVVPTSETRDPGHGKRMKGCADPEFYRKFSRSLGVRQ